MLVPAGLSTDAQAMIERIVAVNKPAHTSFDVRGYYDLFIVGQARLGIDTQLGAHPLVLPHGRGPGLPGRHVPGIPVSFRAERPDRDPTSTGFGDMSPQYLQGAGHDRHPALRLPRTGTLSPDLRVFYHYGMVLGLDEFLEEQTHNLGLDYHHERALHGYGTVYGLHVTTATPPDARTT